MKAVIQSSIFTSIRRQHPPYDYLRRTSEQRPKEIPVKNEGAGQRNSLTSHIDTWKIEVESKVLTALTPLVQMRTKSHFYNTIRALDSLP